MTIVELFVCHQKFRILCQCGFAKQKVLEVGLFVRQHIYMPLSVFIILSYKEFDTQFNLSLIHI